jgi:hypothetical protein
VSCEDVHCHPRHEDFDAFVEAVRPTPRVCEAGSGHAAHCLICTYIWFILSYAERDGLSASGYSIELFPAVAKTHVIFAVCLCPGSFEDNPIRSSGTTKWHTCGGITPRVYSLRMKGKDRVMEQSIRKEKRQRAIDSHLSRAASPLPVPFKLATGAAFSSCWHPLDLDGIATVSLFQVERPR